MAQLAMSSQIKNRINAILGLAGLELGTKRAERHELARLERLSASRHWSTARYDQGLEFEPAKYLQFLNSVCAPAKPDYARLPQTLCEAQEGFVLQNDWFGAVDAEVLYSIVRYFRPRSIFEVGSGYSTALMRRSIREGQLQTMLTSIDPQPRVDVALYCDRAIRTGVQELGVGEIVDSLQKNDILFIDSSHVIQTGGDVPYLYLELIPRLRPGVLIHVHDIFIPFDYPEHFVKARYGWAEQYLLHAFLSYNSVFEIIWPSYYMWHFHRERLSETIPIREPAISPSSFWMRRLK